MKCLICGTMLVLETMLAMSLATAHPPEFHQHGSDGDSKDGHPAVDHLAIYFLARFGGYDDRYFDGRPAGHRRGAESGLDPWQRGRPAAR